MTQQQAEEAIKRYEAAFVCCACGELWDGRCPCGGSTAVPGRMMIAERRAIAIRAIRKLARADIEQKEP